MDVRLPDGTILRGVPEGTTKAQIAQKMGGLPQPESGGFLQGVGETVGKRHDELQGIVKQYQDGNQGLLETGFQFVGKGGAGTLNDIAGEGFKSMGRGVSSLTPDFIEEPVKNVARSVGRYVANSPAGDLAKSAISGYQNFATNHPRAARNIEAATNLGTMLPLAGPVGRAGAVAAPAIADATIAGAKTVGRSALSAAERLNTRTVIPTSEEVRIKAGDLFKQLDNSGVSLSPDVADKFRGTVIQNLNLNGEAKLFASNPVAERLVNNIGEFAGKPMTFGTAKQIDEALGDLAYSTMDNFGKLDATGKKFLDLQGVLRESMESVPGNETLTEARKLWSSSLRMRDIERIVERSRGKEQPATVIKNGFNTLLNRGDKLKSYSPAEVRAIQKAAQTGIVTDAFKLAGSGLVPIGSAVAGAFGGPIGSALGFGAGYIAQQGAKAVGIARQTSRANKAIRAVAEGSGLVRKESRINAPAIPDSWRSALRLKPKQEQKMLPAPKYNDEFVSDTLGNVRRVTPEERLVQQAARERETLMGMEPGTRMNIVRRETREKFGPMWDSIEKSQQEKIAFDINKAWRENPNASMDDLIEQAVINAQELYGATGKQFQPGAMGDALLKAKKKP